MFKTLSVLLGILLFAQPLFAADEKKQGVWSGEAELGLIYTSGNTETDTVNAKAKIGTEVEKWRHVGEVSALKTSDATGTTAQKFDLKAQSDYKFAEKEYFFGIFTYEDEKFSGYDYRATLAAGYGRRVYNENDMTLDLEAGPGFRHSKPEVGSSDTEFMVRGAAKYAWAITKTSKLTEDLTIEAGDEVTVTKSVTALSSKINGDLAMKISYTIKHTSDVPPLTEKTDTELAVTLVYSY